MVEEFDPTAYRRVEPPPVYEPIQHSLASNCARILCNYMTENLHVFDDKKIPGILRQALPPGFMNLTRGQQVFMDIVTYQWGSPSAFGWKCRIHGCKFDTPCEVKFKRHQQSMHRMVQQRSVIHQRHVGAHRPRPRPTKFFWTRAVWNKKEEYYMCFPY